MTMSGAGEKRPRRIVFLGPSIPLARATRILPDAEFRPPIRRGDLDDIPGGNVVGIIDGLFAETLAISPGEIRNAIERGVAVYGAASMGALRAAEVPRVVGVGRVFEMYQSGMIERDDEVAVLVSPVSNEALTEALVNVRYSVERLVRSGTLNRTDGDAIIEAGLRLHYSDRTYHRILSESTLARNKDLDDIIHLLSSFSLKQDDAQLLLERLATAPFPLPASEQNRALDRKIEPLTRVKVREAADSPVLIWESGDKVTFSNLVNFVKLTGKFEGLARNVIARMAVADRPILKSALASKDSEEEHLTNASQALLDRGRAQWGWDTPEEAHVTMRDLGLGLDDIAGFLDADVQVRRLISAFGRSPSDDFSKALRAIMWFDQLSLKREALRYGALQYFAHKDAGAGPPSSDEILEARRTVARLLSVFRWDAIVTTLHNVGLEQPELDEMIGNIALARRSARPVVDSLDGKSCAPPSSLMRLEGWDAFGIEPSPKAEGSRRFSLSEADASRRAEQIAKQMGIVRIGLVGQLDVLGIYIAQSFGQRSGWSSSFSSGKAETRDGARVGSIMEEVEIYAQDAYLPSERLHARFAESSHALALLDPRELGLPYDSCFRDDLAIDWSPCTDLVSGGTFYIPTACLVGERQVNDILYSPRLGGKVFSSSGLGSGFSLAEAIVHAAAEYIERHAYRLAEIELDNPGDVGIRQFWFVDERSLPEIPARIVDKYNRAGMCVRILDITSEIAVPTFYVRVFDDLFKVPSSMSADGFACHPDPEVAVTMALLEAAQTRGGFIAGGREDYSLQARSLGRHERPRTAVPRSQAFWFSNDRPVRPLNHTEGFCSRDIRDELAWMVDRVISGGCDKVLVADYTIPNINPARAVRVLIPGLETTNPLFTGPRARATVLRDLLLRS
jgi:ribosomal protein S12 methylthiotransferase accessory factor